MERVGWSEEMRFNISRRRRMRGRPIFAKKSFHSRPTEEEEKGAGGGFEALPLGRV
jgi:hypothetical protein